MMKKVLLAGLCFVLLTLSVKAQTSKNTLLLGGNLTFNSIEKNSSFSASPNIGFFVAENFAIGGEFNLYTTDGFTSWGVGPFARYYFGKNANGKPFAGASFAVGGADGSDTKTGFGAHAGYAVFLNQSIALELLAKYNRMNKTDMVTLGAGFQIHLHK